MLLSALLTSILFFFLPFGKGWGGAAFAQSYQWAKSAGGTSSDYGTSVTADASGNIIVTGYFTDSSISFGTTTLTNAGSDDIFIVKYDGSGNVIWAKREGGTNQDRGNSVTADASGNIIVTGFFSNSSISFGTTVLTNTNAGSADIFIVKYDGSGNVIWAKSAGETSSDYGNSVTADASGNIIVTGYFTSSSITFGTITLTNASAGYDDIFIVKYDGSGNVIWAESAGGTNYDVSYSVTADASGNIMVTGSFRSPSISFGTTTLTNAGLYDIFIVKYNGSGNVLWAKSEGGTSSDVGNSVTADASGNIMVTGSFGSPSITFGTTTLTNAGFADILIVKYDGSGNVLWAKSAGGTDDDRGNSVTADASGNIMVTGSFNSSSITFGTTTLTNAGYADIFIVKYDGSGTVLWAKSAGGTSYDRGYSVTADASGNIIVTGGFYNSSITFGTTTLTNAGTYDIFIVKLNGATGIEENGQGEGVSVFPNPFTHTTTITIDNGQMTMDNFQVLIYDVLGQVVHQEKILTPKYQILNLGLPSGIYFYKVKNGVEIIANGKLIIQ